MNAYKKVSLINMLIRDISSRKTFIMRVGKINLKHKLKS